MPKYIAYITFEGGYEEEVEADNEQDAETQIITPWLHLMGDLEIHIELEMVENNDNEA